MRLLPRLRVVAICLVVGGCSSGASSSGSGGSGQPGGSGGTTASGGASGTGGSSGSGGTSTAGSGGTGVSGTGGTVASGGTHGSGGDSGSGGTNGTGGTTGTGGMTGSGGAGTAGRGGGTGGTAGSSASGGAGGSGAAGTSGGNGRPKRVLLYSFSTSTIGGVSQQLSDLEQTLKGWGYEVDKVSDPMSGMVFSDSNLAKYAGVGMINTCFYPFGSGKNDTAAGIAESQALKKFLQEGGGLFGTHCAEVTFQSATTMPLYNQLLGGWAHSGKNSGDNADMTCTKEGSHPTSDMLPATFSYKGNVDDADVAKDATVLVSCKYGSSTTPVSWVRTEGTGRVFNTSFGKVEADLKDATIGAKHIIAGLGWVLGR